MRLHGSSAAGGMLACLLMLRLALPVVAAPAPKPLSDEDVVRMWVAGTPVSELIERIRASEVDFDVSDEMLDELRLAGLPPELIEAMRARQLEVHPPEPSPEPRPDESAPAPVLRVRLNPGRMPKRDMPRAVLRVLDAVSPQSAETLGLRTEERQLTDLAIVLICRTADHVPDHWRSQSPLGRDFVLTPRHRLLAFLPGARRGDPGKLRRKLSRAALAPGERAAAPELALLELDVPEEIEVELEPVVAHDLTLGIAVQAGERYFLVAQAERDGLVLDGQELELSAELESNGLDPGTLKVRFLSPAD